MQIFRKVLFLFLTIGITIGCKKDNEVTMTNNDEAEVINKVILTFTPTQGGDAITATWFDADGEGAGTPKIDEIKLQEEVKYTLTMALTNTLEDPDEDITKEIKEEDNEHLFFFAFTEGFFSDPAGDGNVDKRDDKINYNDMDDNNVPIGLSTTWTTGKHQEKEGSFKVILKHQPNNIKSATSSAKDGDTDIEITFSLHIVEKAHDHGNEDEEVINKVVLTFTPTQGGNAITATWFDNDGEGVANPTIDNINLAANTVYNMTVMLTNTLEDPDEDVTAEIRKEDNEHLFFFEFTDGIFTSPTGNGNVDNRNDPLNYNDTDENNLPVGLSTRWTTGATTNSAANFKIILKHQPEVKTSTSTSKTGGTDIEITFPLNIM